MDAWEIVSRIIGVTVEYARAHPDRDQINGAASAALAKRLPELAGLGAELVERVASAIMSVKEKCDIRNRFTTETPAGDRWVVTLYDCGALYIVESRFDSPGESELEDIDHYYFYVTENRDEAERKYSEMVEKAGEEYMETMEILRELDS